MQEFLELSKWRRAKNGSLWRRWQGLTVTVFYRGRRFYYSIAGDDGPQCSERSYGDEQEAMEALGEALEVGR